MLLPLFVSSWITLIMYAVYFLFMDGIRNPPVVFCRFYLCFEKVYFKTLNMALSSTLPPPERL